MSSHDALHPDRGAGMPRGDSDAMRVPPLISMSIDDLPTIQGPLASSGSGDNFGSSPFGVPATRIAPDPLLEALAGAVAVPQTESVMPPDRPLPSAEFGALAALNLDKPVVRKLKQAEPVPDQGDEDVVYLAGPNWPMRLLASYASAVTLALIWWVVLPKFRGKAEVEGFTPGAPAVAVGTRLTDPSRKVEIAAPIPRDRIVKLGQSLKIGALEITPLDTARQSVKLRRDIISGGTKERDGGSNALALRIKMRNTSSNVLFSPLDKAFVRDKDDGVPDSFVELLTGDRVYLYPLPVESEWSIIGQEFPSLRPGEVKETRVVTSSDFPTTNSGMTWRLRLRTGPDSTAVVGVSIPPGK